MYAFPESALAVSSDTKMIHYVWCLFAFSDSVRQICLILGPTDSQALFSHQTIQEGKWTKRKQEQHVINVWEGSVQWLQSQTTLLRLKSRDRDWWFVCHVVQHTFSAPISFLPLSLQFASKKSTPIFHCFSDNDSLSPSDSRGVHEEESLSASFISHMSHHLLLNCEERVPCKSSRE